MTIRKVDGVTVDGDTVDGKNPGAASGLATLDAGSRVTESPKLHEGDHVSGGDDDVDSALAIAAMAGLTTDKIWKGVAGRPSEVDAPSSSGLAIFGDGSDGDVTISAHTSLTRDMFYDDLTVDSTKELRTAGYRIFVKGTLTNNGTILDNQHGTPGTGKDGDTGGGGSGTQGFSVNPGSLMNNDCDAGLGKDGPDPGDAGESTSYAIGGDGGAGGAGGATAGGAAGTVTATVATGGGHRALPLAAMLMEIIIASYKRINGGASGGGGGGNAGGGNDSGGGGGAGGGIVYIAAKTIDNGSGTIEANGGDGGAGGNGGDTGGGGGGGGGGLILIYNSLTTGTETANGGTGGAAGGGGVEGTNGDAGVVIKIPNV